MAPAPQAGTAAGLALYPHVLSALTRLVIEPAVGARFASIARWLQEFYRWDPARRLAWQQERLRATVAYAAQHVPSYRAVSAEGELQGADPLAYLPVVDKARIRADMPAFLSEEWTRLPQVPKRTGGTTGDPWRYPLDRRAWAHMYGAQLYNFERVGVRYGERIVTLGVPTSLGLGSMTWKARLRHALERRDVTHTSFEVDHDASLRRALWAGQRRAALWYGYAGTIAAMADAALEEGVRVRGPRAIVTMAEPLQPAWRERIEQAFGAPVYDEYGCNDGGLLAFTCEHGRFHVAENLSIVEVLEGGRPCPPGVEGDVTVTNLHARLLPFLRYQTGDRAVLGDGVCGCGRAGVTLERMAGRWGDRVRLPDGTLLSVMTFAQVFKETPDVRRWQVVQPSPDRLTIRVEARPGFDTAQERLIIDDVRARTAGLAEVTVALVEVIAVTPGGKHKVVIREFD